MPRKNTSQLLLALTASLLLGSVTGPASGAGGGSEAGLNLMEWSALPDFCKTSFMSSSYAYLAPQEAREQKKLILQSAGSVNHGIPGAHHFCMGLVKLDRARRGIGSYDGAVGELSYSAYDMEPDAPAFSFVRANLGTALYRAGKRKDASIIWSQGIKAQPQRRESYLAMASALLSERRPQEALDLLLKYEAVKDGDYADTEHFLAQTYFELKKYDEARQHAQKAYDLGYPVFGLRDKLKQLGKW